jgi:hypothetical protein
MAHLQKEGKSNLKPKGDRSNSAPPQHLNSPEQGSKSAGVKSSQHLENCIAISQQSR